LRKNCMSDHMPTESKKAGRLKWRGGDAQKLLELSPPGAGIEISVVIGAQGETIPKYGGKKKNRQAEFDPTSDKMLWWGHLENLWSASIEPLEKGGERVIDGKNSSTHEKKRFGTGERREKALGAKHVEHPTHLFRVSSTPQKKKIGTGRAIHQTDYSDWDALTVP